MQSLHSAAQAASWLRSRVTGKLRTLLEDMDSDASDWIQTHAELLAAAYPSHLPGIREALEGFDFDVAIAQLDEAISNRGVAL